MDGTERYPDPAEPQWTNAYFQDLVSDMAGAFVCDYPTCPSRVTSTSVGGAWPSAPEADLGVLDAVRLVIATRDVEAARARWQRLLDPCNPAERATWHPVIGPAIAGAQGRERT